MSLKEFQPDAADMSDLDDNRIQSSLYLQELNTLKIDKLGHRVTIISVIIPVLIGVVMFFSYLDIKERMTSSDTRKTSQVAYLTRQSEERFNALDVRIAKNRFELDEKLPNLIKRSQAMEDQVARLASTKADTTAMDSRFLRTESALEGHDKRIRNNAAQDKAMVSQMERINTTLLATIEENQAYIQKSVQTLTREITDLRETVDEKVADFLKYQKDLSLLDKRIRDVARQQMPRKQVEQQLTAIETALARAVDQLTRKLEKTGSAPVPKGAGAARPNTDTGESPGKDTPPPDAAATIPATDTAPADTGTVIDSAGDASVSDSGESVTGKADADAAPSTGGQTIGEETLTQ